MKSRAVKTSTVIFLCLLLAGAALGIAFAAGTAAGGAEVESVLAAGAVSGLPVTPEPAVQEPVGTAQCRLEHADGAVHLARVISSPAELAWLFSNSRSAEELSACYILDLPGVEAEIDGAGSEIAGVNITGWSDTGVGKCAAAECYESHASCTPFTGHFDGNGNTIVYAFAESLANSSRGGTGLFPCLQGGVVTDLDLQVVQTPDAAVQTGALSRFANAEAIIRNVTVRQTFNQADPIADDDDLHSKGYWSAGVVAYNMGSVSDCTSVSQPQVLQAGGTNVFGLFGGITLCNAGGNLTRCIYQYNGGDGGILNSSGGIARTNAGDISGCKSIVTGTGLAARYFGGIVNLIDGGSITDCYVSMDIGTARNDMLWIQVGGIAGSVNYTNRVELADPNYAAAIGDVAIEDCRVTSPAGGKIAAHNRIGGIAAYIAPINDVEVAIRRCEVGAVTIESVYDNLSNTGGILGRVAVPGALVLEDCISYAEIRCKSGLSGGLWGQMYTSAGVSRSVNVNNCHVYAESVEVVDFVMPTVEGSIYNTQLGGFYGNLDTYSQTADISITNCTTTANVRVTGEKFLNLGGFGGFTRVINTPEQTAPVLADCYAYGSVENKTGGGYNGGFISTVQNSANVLIKGCAAYGSVTTQGDFNGGFTGLNNVNTNMRYTDCEAYGAVNIYRGNDAISHFAGFSGADINTAPEINQVYSHCNAYGSIVVKTPGYVAQAGGFIGYIDTSTRYEYCNAYGDVNMPSRSGGFFGIMANLSAGSSVEFAGCTATGNVYGGAYSGGFGGHIWNNDPTVTVTFKQCTAYGSVLKYPVRQSAGGVGGFLGNIYMANVSLTDCVAYGSASGNKAAGFIGYLQSVEKVEIRRCKAYGNAYDNPTPEEGIPNAHASGFIADANYAEGSENQLVLDSCDAYGSAYVSYITSPSVQGGWSGGFLGPMDVIVKATNCNAYGAVVDGGYVTRTAGFAVMLGATGAGSTFTNCHYSDKSLHFFQNNQDEDEKATATNCGTATAVPDASVPRPTVQYQVSQAGGGVKIDFTAFKNISSTVTELAVSLDDGKTNTLLVYGGKTLVTMTDSSGADKAIAPGSTIAVPAVSKFSVTYATLTGYPAGSIQIRIKFANGFTVICHDTAWDVPLETA